MPPRSNYQVSEPEMLVLNFNTAYESAAGRKSFHSIDIQRTNQDHSPSLNSSLHPKTSWNETEHLNVPDNATEKSIISQDSKIKLRYGSENGTWIFEVVSLLVSFLAVASIAILLAHFDGRALPDWPLNITLNTLVALLATLANANLAIPLQSGLSQLKWIRFKTKRTPLSDIEVFDDASRGTWGSILLLVKLRGGFFGSFGALIAIVALALGPFAQQIVTYRNHFVQSGKNATIPTALNYTGVLPGDGSNPFVPILPLKSAVYYGLFSESDPSANLKFNCPTGNCTWPEFTTLAVCSSCIDLTSYLTRYCQNGIPANGNVSTCGWQVPQGAYLNTSSDVFSMTSLFPSVFGNQPYANIMRLIFMGTEAQNGPPLNYNPWATECTLQYCLQTFNSSVTNGVIQENVTSTTTNNTVVDISGSTANVPVVITAPNSVVYEVGEGASLGIRSWFEGLFTLGSATRNTSYINSTRTLDSVVVNLTVGISSGTTYFDSDVVQTFYWDYYEYTEGLELAMSELATAMTVAFRSFNGAIPVEGQAFNFESYVHVRWGWIGLPVAVVALAALFLLAAIYKSKQTKTALWKSSALAMLFNGLDDETRAVFASEISLSSQKRHAKEVKVQLDQGGNDGSFLRS
ncbi:MAG: hypothetical protein MMC33_010795 [Icmadophila ericetorum]|nr:hypothetical protein [Icmadophila ericetorum]